MAETLGTGFLPASVVGSGILGDRLAGGNKALTLRQRTVDSCGTVRDHTQWDNDSWPIPVLAERPRQLARAKDSGEGPPIAEGSFFAWVGDRRFGLKYQAIAMPSRQRVAACGLLDPTNTQTRRLAAVPAREPASGSAGRRIRHSPAHGARRWPSALRASVGRLTALRSAPGSRAALAAMPPGRCRGVPAARWSSANLRH